MKTIGFIGLGLIGGSIAKTIRKFHPDYHILAYAKHKETLAAALNCGAIDATLEERDDRYAMCDYIFLCAPVEYNIEYLRYLKDVIKEGCIITDAGSVKGPIHKAVEELGMEYCFIGGHPMAGSEKTGIANAKRHLLENAYYVLTPTDEVSQDKIDRYEKLVRTIKALPLILSCQEHDYVTAAISHLPHLIASSLVNLVKDCDNENDTMKTLAAGGFKDITRIASSSPEMWEQICSTNRENIISVLDDYINSLISIKIALAEHDNHKIYRLFETSRDYRNSISNVSRGSFKKDYSIYCDLVDEVGGIAALATILATNGISIKNIGIVHNREFEEAVLQVEFYEETTRKKAVELLRRYRYTVYER